VVKKIYLVRHAQSEANAAGRVQGWADSPLSRQGRQQAQLLAERLAAEPPIEAIFSSSLQRAAETARIIAARLNCSLKFDDDLREYNMGPITGLTAAEIREKFPARYAAYERNEPLPQLPGAESESVFLERVRRGMERVVEQTPEQQTGLVVAHGGSLNACLINWLGLRQRRRFFRFGNASLSLVEINAAGERIIYLNDTHHLDKLDALEGFEE
jgi:broad specificity phosphatase PhoE